MVNTPETPLISIIIPVYNVEDYFARCIDSVISQSYTNLEIILVDDGSPDRCPAICDEYSQRDERIIVIHKKNGGLSDARNAGIDRAKGRYVTFVDSDDYVDPDYISQLYKILVENNADISICGHTVRYSNGKIIPHYSDHVFTLNPEKTLEKILYDDELCTSAWAKLYKLELFDKIRFPKGENFEDSSTTYKLIMLSKTIACNMRSQYNYMIRPNSIMTEPFSEKKLLYIISWDNMGEAVLNEYPNLRSAVNRGRTYARLSILRQIAISKKTRETKKLGQKIRKEVLKTKTESLLDKKCPRRDKVAMVLLSFGMLPFGVSWRLYCLITGRSAE